MSPRTGTSPVANSLSNWIETIPRKWCHWITSSAPQITHSTSPSFPMSHPSSPYL
ncbi:hypothetical protein M407DRAFT_243316 [Tulasnella calospora MUT 4182]|uniref:Uncharacterized protein n=1 Tax=Tulasnella calospora MUT 4182 TaxID=1051891 RepID=A0A0C3QLM8_9AGAM|nr:hypothetical protein M407DRAFT_243316 [Tulasnella calospora MUT 4182]